MHLFKALKLPAAGLAVLAVASCSDTGGIAAGGPWPKKAGWLERDRYWPESPLFRRIKDEVDRIRIADTHEHLISEKFWLEQQDYSLFNWFRQPWFPQYSGSDLVSAGMSEDYLEAMKDTTISYADRWKMASPYWPFAATTGFGQAIRLAVRDIYGLEDINDGTWEELIRRIKTSQQPGFYKKVLYDMAGIDVMVLDQIVLVDPYVQDDFAAVDKKPRVALVRRFDDTFIRLTKASLVEISGQFGRPVETLDDLLAALDRQFEALVASGRFVGVKSALAYDREIHYEDVPQETAKALFNRIKEGDISFEERRPFEDFMFHQVTRRVGEHGLVMQLHTGMLAGPPGNIARTRVSHLNNVFEKFPGTKFAIFHGSFPYMGELAAIAKNYQNVWLDNCWMPIISPSQTKEWMHSWIETVPINKIMAFGGDYIFPEGSYGHSLVARQIVSEVLAEKVEQGYFSEEEAVWAARRMLRDNAIELFGLQKFLPE